MRNRLILLVSLGGLGLMLIQPVLAISARALSGETAVKRVAQQPAGLSDSLTVRAAGRGNPWINFNDGHPLLGSYAGEEAMVQLLRQNQVRPLALASDDFDEDAMADLVCGYAGPRGGLLALHHSNLDAIYRNTSAPFLSPARLYRVPEAPDFLSTGDFNADGHRDLLAASTGGAALYVLPGDGQGNLRSPQRIALPGRVTALAAGEINRAVGLTSVAVGVVRSDGPKALVFDGARGGLSRQPEVIALPAEATALSLGRLDEDRELDLAAAAGRQVLIVTGRNPTLSPSEIPWAEQLPADIDRQYFPSAITSMALGDFLPDHRRRLEVALLTEDGTVHVVAQAESNGREPRTGGHVKKWESNILAAGRWPRAASLVPARVSIRPADDLIVIDPLNRQLHLLIDQGETRVGSQGTALVPTPRRRAAVSLNTEAAPVAILPMRLNGDALSDLVILDEGSSRPTVTLTAPLATVTVDSTTDVDDGDISSISNLIADPGPDGVISLREALTAANNTPGMDTIEFDIPHATDPGCDPGSGVCTILVQVPLPVITDPVTIDAIPQSSASFPQSSFSLLPSSFSVDTYLSMMDDRLPPCKIAVEGVDSAPAGLNLAAPNSVLQGLAIFGFQVGIRVSGQGNMFRFNQLGGWTQGNGEGGFNVGAGNMFMFNEFFNNGDGISNVGPNATGNEFMKNLFWGNKGAAAGFASGASDNMFTWNAGSGNGIGIIDFNDAVNNAFSSNQIYDNDPSRACKQCAGLGFGGGAFSNMFKQNDDGLGIDLDFDGVTRNDRGDGDRGANNRQNFPVLMAASQSNETALTALSQGDGTTIEGSFNSRRNATFMLEFFANVECDPSGFGEGQFPIGSMNVTTDRRGNADFELTVPLIVPAGNVITATATDPAGNTSEFSECIGVMGTAVPDGVLTKSGPESISCNQSITYQITAGNDGAATALAAILLDELPDCLTDIRCEATQGTCVSIGNTVVALLGTLDPDASATITITATVSPDCAPSISNTATLTVPSDGNEENNTSTVTTSVNCNP